MIGKLFKIILLCWFIPSLVLAQVTGQGPIRDIGNARNEFIPPTPPNFIAAINVTANSIDWRFEDLSLNELGFQLKDSSGKTVMELGRDEIVFQETGLAENTKYSRYIIAMNHGGASGPSNTLTAYTLITLPRVNLIVNETNSMTVGVAGYSEFPIEHLEDSTAFRFKLFEVGQEGSGGGPLETAWDKSVSHTFSDLVSGQAYEAMAQARNAEGLETSWSTPMFITTKVPEVEAPSVAAPIEALPEPIVSEPEVVPEPVVVPEPLPAQVVLSPEPVSESEPVPAVVENIIIEPLPVVPVVMTMTQSQQQIDSSVAGQVQWVILGGLVVITGLDIILFPSLLPLLYRIWFGILVFLGIKKKGKPWGIVYDAILKEPIPLVIVRLFKRDGSNKKLIETTVTNANGQFNLLPREGEFTLEAGKNTFKFPSDLIKGKNDEDYKNIYLGKTLSYKNERSARFDLSVPMDPINFNSLKRPAYKRYGHMIRVTISAVAFGIYIIGFIISLGLFIKFPDLLGAVVVALYLMVVILRFWLQRQGLRNWGTVFAGGSGDPIPLATIVLLNAKSGKMLKTRLTDYHGRYSFLPPAGDYKILVQAKGYKFPATKKAKYYRHQYFGDKFKIDKKSSIIDLNIPMQ